MTTQERLKAIQALTTAAARKLAVTKDRKRRKAIMAKLAADVLALG
jgi:hypothetical protein